MTIAVAVSRGTSLENLHVFLEVQCLKEHDVVTFVGTQDLCQVPGYPDTRRIGDVPKVEVILYSEVTQVWRVVLWAFIYGTWKTVIAVRCLRGIKYCSFGIFGHTDNDYAVSRTKRLEFVTSLDGHKAVILDR